MGDVFGWVGGWVGRRGGWVAGLADGRMGGQATVLLTRCASTLRLRLRAAKQTESCRRLSGHSPIQPHRPYPNATTTHLHHHPPTHHPPPCALSALPPSSSSSTQLATHLVPRLYHSPSSTTRSLPLPQAPSSHSPPTPHPRPLLHLSTSPFFAHASLYPASPRPHILPHRPITPPLTALPHTIHPPSHAHAPRLQVSQRQQREQQPQQEQQPLPHQPQQSRHRRHRHRGGHRCRRHRRRRHHHHHHHTPP